MLNTFENIISIIFSNYDISKVLLWSKGLMSEPSYISCNRSLPNKILFKDKTQNYYIQPDRSRGWECLNLHNTFLTRSKK